MSRSRGQLNIEFISAVLIFGLLAAYIVVFVYDLLPEFSLRSNTESMRAKAYQISDLMLGDAGISDAGGTDWTSADVRRVGLARNGEPYVINYTKLVHLNQTSYERIIDGFDPDFNIMIVIQNATDESVLVKAAGPNASAQTVNILRVAPMVVDGRNERVKMVLTVWKS